MTDIRLAQPADSGAIWEIFQAVIQTGDTYVYPPDTPREALADLWLAPTMQTYVAEENGRILGTYILKPNFPGRGAHVANSSYMVHTAAQGLGIGTAMAGHSLVEARRLGFKAMQFNLVVSTNLVLATALGATGAVAIILFREQLSAAVFGTPVAATGLTIMSGTRAFR